MPNENSQTVLVNDNVVHVLDENSIVNYGLMPMINRHRLPVHQTTVQGSMRILLFRWIPSDDDYQLQCKKKKIKYF